MPLFPFNRSKSTPSARPPMGRRSVAWLLLIPALALMLLWKQTSDNSIPEMSYSSFRQEVAKGNVVSVVMVDGKVLKRIEFRNPVHLKDIPGEVRQAMSILPVANDSDLRQSLEAAHVSIGAEMEHPGVMDLLVNLIPTVLFIGLLLWIVKKNTAGGVFAFGKSKPKGIEEDSPKTTFADVAGVEEAKQSLTEIVGFLKDPARFGRLGGRLPRGVLLVGPPGTGKTLLARAVAGEAGRPFLRMSGSEFVEFIVGVGASRVRDLFAQAKLVAPCIIFIDEIDAVGRQRGTGIGGGGHDEREQTLNQLLVEMDGFDANSGVIVLAATNRPDVLDVALLRPGRFDRQVVVDSPDVTGREAILKVHASSRPMAEDVDLKAIAKVTSGMSGADLANVINEAALMAASRSTEAVQIHMTDVEQALDKAVLGMARTSMVLSERERTLTAYHEAGHTVTALKIKGNDPVHRVTIVPRGRALGVTASAPDSDRHSYTRSFLEGRLAMIYGGRAAEKIIFGEDEVTTGASNDIQQATSMAHRMVTQFGMSEEIGLVAVETDPADTRGPFATNPRGASGDVLLNKVDTEVRKITAEGYRLAEETLLRHKPLLVAVAASLLEKETLGRADLERLVREYDDGVIIPLEDRLMPPSLPEEGFLQVEGVS